MPWPYAGASAPARRDTTVYRARRRRSCVASRSAPAAQPLQLQRSADAASPTGTEVLLKVLAAGVCHSDLHLSDGYFDLGGGKQHEPRTTAA